jgi:hypothetical protein
MESHDRPIEIFAPFVEAFELMRKILFQPFDLTKWLVIGFAAWIATFFNSGPFDFRSFRKGDWRWHSYHYRSPISIHHTPPWAIPLILIGGVIALAIVIALLWVNSRGRFVFTDCIVRNRGAIAEPWREFRNEGNRYFGFQLIVMLCSLFVGGGVALLFVLRWYWGDAFFPFAILILLGVVIVLIAILIGLVLRFVVPVMYRRHCGAMEAFGDVLALVSAYPGQFVLFVLFYIVLAVAAATIGCVAACVTCCVAAIPYIGTVILLPLVMVLYAFPLCFLRQFGDQYDAWAVVRPAEPPSPPIPPVQDILPPS